MFRELLPNMLSRIAAGFTFVFITAVFFEAALEFLGFADVNKISWGTILYWATVNSTLLQGEWWHFVFPGLAISLTILAMVFINYGIDELADPRLRVKEERRGLLAVCSGRGGPRDGGARRPSRPDVARGLGTPLLEIRDLVVAYGSGHERGDRGERDLARGAARGDRRARR